MIEGPVVLIYARGNHVKIVAKQPRSGHDDMKVMKLREEGRLVEVILRPHKRWRSTMGRNPMWWKLWPRRDPRQ